MAMSDTEDHANRTEWQQRLHACAEAWSVAYYRFAETLQRRETLYGLILAAEKAGDSAALAAHYKDDGHLDAEYDASIRALRDAHRNHISALQDAQDAAAALGISPLDLELGMEQAAAA